MGKSRRHERLAESLDHLVLAVAAHLQIECEPSGEATYRRREKEAGVEGDRTFHFGTNAERMRGMENYDFEVDPPPDLAIEVEATHPADDAIAAPGRLNVPEVWRFDAATTICTFWNCREDGALRASRSQQVPAHARGLVRCRRSDQPGRGNSEPRDGTSSFEDWVRDVIRSRLEGVPLRAGPDALTIYVPVSNSPMSAEVCRVEQIVRNNLDERIQTGERPSWRLKE